MTQRVVEKLAQLQKKRRDVNHLRVQSLDSGGHDFKLFYFLSLVLKSTLLSRTQYQQDCGIDYQSGQYCSSFGLFESELLPLMETHSRVEDYCDPFELESVSNKLESF